MIVNLPGGHTAVIRDKPTVGGRDLLREEAAELFGLIAEKFPEAETLEDPPLHELGRDGMRAFTRFNRAGVIALLKSWTLPDPLPTMDTIGEMEDPDTYDALLKAVSPLILKATIGDTFDAKDVKDPDSPTEPSIASSKGSGRKGAKSTLTTSLPTGS